jgi:VIT1/CCC1 family predicted Fe2+/Mn2+ transporter
MPSDDAERFRRIRDKQIAARDPMVKVRKLDSAVSAKQRRMRESFSVGRMWTDIPKMWRYMLLGLVVGVLVLAVLPLFVPAPWGVIGGVGVIFFLIILGMGLGRYEDSKDEIKHLVKH